jgi:predicted metal-dependent hydrolase
MPRIRKKSLAELDLSTVAQFALSPEEKKHFTRGIALFNNREFWEAHEAWEEIWQNHPEDGRFFIQGLIQLAAAYHQLLRKIYRGYVIHLKRAQERLMLFPALFLGINVAALLETIDASLKTIELEESQAEVDFSQMEIPEIELAQLDHGRRHFSDL